MLKKFVLSSVALIVLYGNLGTMLTRMPRDYGFRLPLPVPSALRNAFTLYGVFGGDRKNNSDFVFVGRRTSEGKQRWDPIDVSEYLPRHRGRRNTFVWTSRHRALGRERQQQAWVGLASKLRQRYNRDHPQAPVEKIGIAQEDWPLSPEGFDAVKNPERTKTYKLFTEP